MYCKKCGSKINENNKFCTKCGTTLDFSNLININKKKSKVKLCILILLACLIIAGAAIATAFIYNDKKSGVDNNFEEKTSEVDSIALKNDGAGTYIEKNFGFANNITYATLVGTKKTNGTSHTISYNTTFNDNSNGGAVFYKILKNTDCPNGLLCVYLDADQKGIAAKVSFIYDYKKSESSYTTTISTSDVNNRCYCVIYNDCLLTIELLEHRELSKSSFYDDEYYEEKITAYDFIGEEMSKKFEITRRTEPRITGNLKNYTITQGDTELKYVEGYGSYKDPQAEFLSTEQDFCDKGNELLSVIDSECVSLLKTSWDDRWNGLNIDESNLNKNMVKIDFTTSDPITVNNEERYDIVVNVNNVEAEIIDYDEDESNTPIPTQNNQTTDD